MMESEEKRASFTAVVEARPNGQQTATTSCGTLEERILFRAFKMAVLKPPSLLELPSEVCDSGSNGLVAMGIDSSICDFDDSFQLRGIQENELEESNQIWGSITL